MNASKLRIWLLLLPLLTITATAGLAATSLPAGSQLARSDGDGLALTLRFDAADFRLLEDEDGLYLHLDGCALTSAGDAGQRSGAPMLPLWRGQAALPPGHEARLSWRVLASEPVDGRPLPFPTPVASPAGEERIYSEQLIEDAAAYGESFALRARLGETRRLRDLRVVEILVEPVGWDPERGLTLATEIALELRFVPSATARAAASRREPVRAPEAQWERVYGGALLNGGEAPAWRRRVPTATRVQRGERAEAALKLLCADDGLYGVPGDSLAAHGIALGTSLSEIALYRHAFDWDPSEQPVFEQIAEPRYFVDRDSDGLLDGDDRLVFMGWRLRNEPASVDSIEWYGRASARFVAVAPELALPMATEPGWLEGGVWPLRDGFRRTFWDQGENHFHHAPPPWTYDDAPAETWDHNLYYYRPPLATTSYNILLPVDTPGYQAGSAATLNMLFQGASRSSLDASRDFLVSIENTGPGCDLPPFTVHLIDTLRFEASVTADCLVDGANTLKIDRTDGTQWRTYLQWWRLAYDSDYVARDDSLHFHADGEVGSAEIRVAGLAAGLAEWQLVRVGADGPRRVTLGASNASGGPGDYTLSLRRALDGGEAWWLASAATLRLPALETPASIAVIDDLAPADVLVIAHDEFANDMQRWVDYRSASAHGGYEVKLLRTSEVWDAFFAGTRGAIGVRNAARFAFQQWGTATLLLVGDSNKDARSIHDDITNWEPTVDFVPTHSKHEFVGVDELVALEEWVVKFEWNAWPAMFMGRLPVGSGEELTNVLDKIECFENTDSEGPCGTDEAWRKRFLLVADDCWGWDSADEPVECRSNEYEFENGTVEAGQIIDDGWVGDLEYVPFNLSVLTEPWYAEHPGALPTDLEILLRPIVSPVFLDSLSQGYLAVAVQSHANRGQICHELIVKTSGGGADHTLLTNENKPFFFQLFGCHGNEFAAYNEGKSTGGDCLGEKFLLVGGVGAVASYASDGFEYLFPNIRWEKDWWQIMAQAVDAESQFDVFPEWRAGELQMIAELRFGDFEASYRTHLLGDPLLRLDAAPPRLRLFVDGEEMAAGDRIPVQSPGDTLDVEALVWDETYLADFSLSDPNLGDLGLAATPAFSAETLAPLDSVAPFDTLAVQADGRSRAWHLSGRIPYDFALDALVLSGTDLAGREATFELPAAKAVDFFLADGDSLRWGQWVRADGVLEVRLLVPDTSIPPSAFSLFVDDEPTGIAAEVTADENIYLMTLPYSWAAGMHLVTVRYLDEDYGGIALQVDAGTRLLSGRIFPNPFRNSVTFHFELTNGVREGTLSVYTLSGRRIHREQLGSPSEGQTQVIDWDGRDQTGSKIANGVYIARIVFTDLSGDDLVWEDKVVRMR